MADPRKIVTIDYTNWRGERAERRILPLSVSFENNEWHPESQWLLEALDMDKGEIRTFALASIHAWMPAAGCPKCSDYVGKCPYCGSPRPGPARHAQEG